MLNIEHFQQLIIISCMKHHFDSQLYSDNSGPTSQIIRDIQQANDLASQDLALLLLNSVAG